MKPEAQVALVELSKWVDNMPENAVRDPEALLLHRTVVKIGEELGEVSDALIGALNANPRKGRYASMDDVKKELLDVAITALGAYEHVDGNEGHALQDLERQLVFVAMRAGVIPNPVIEAMETAIQTTRGGFA